MTLDPQSIKSNSPIEEQEQEQEEQWSDSYLVDNLKQHLATVELSKSKTPTDLLDTPNDKFNKFLFNIK